MTGVTESNLGRFDQPLLLFGGPYSNLQACEAIQAAAKHHAIPADRVICTGDLVAYCASPAETIALIRNWGIHCIMGNCEASLAEKSMDCGCGFTPGSACALRSDSWYSYALQHVGKEQREWMHALPRSIRFNLGRHSFLVVHGAPSRINKFIFPSSPRRDKCRELDLANSSVVIGGHCGMPFGQRVDQRFWLNSGAIGLPANDGTPDGWYMLLTPRTEHIEASWHRLPYDCHLASQCMLHAGLNSGYADTLLTGIWPSMEILPNHEQTMQGQPLDPPPIRL